MSASSSSLTFMETELLLIPFAIDRLIASDPAKPVAVLLRERDGERWLPLSVVSLNARMSA